MLCEPVALSLYVGFVYFSFQLCIHSCFLKIFLYGKGAGKQRQQSIKMLK